MLTVEKEPEVLTLTQTEDINYETGYDYNTLPDVDEEEIYEAYQDWWDGNDIDDDDTEVDPIDSSHFDLCPPGLPGCTDEG